MYPIEFGDKHGFKHRNTKTRRMENKIPFRHDEARTTGCGDYR